MQREIETENYRIIESSPYKDGTKPEYFPEVKIKIESQKRYWIFFTKIVVTYEWRRFKQPGFTGIGGSTFNNIKLIALNRITFFDAKDIISFSSLVLAQSWLRRYEEMQKEKNALNRANYLKYLTTQASEDEVKIHDF